MVETVQCKVLAAANCFTNIVVPKQCADELDCELADTNTSVTTVGSPLEYILNLYMWAKGFQKGQQNICCI